MVKPIPEDYRGVIPYLVVDGAAEAIEFYKRAFGATEKMRMPGPDGKIGHAELVIAGSVVMLADEHKDMGHIGPKTLGGSPVGLMFYVEDVDSFFNKAQQAGAEVDSPLENKFYGDRMGTLKDPYGYKWHVATHVEDVPEDEMKERAQAMCGGAAAK